MRLQKKVMACAISVSFAGCASMSGPVTETSVRFDDRQSESVLMLIPSASSGASMTKRLAIITSDQPDDLDPPQEQAVLQACGVEGTRERADSRAIVPIAVSIAVDWFVNNLTRSLKEQ